MRHICCSSILLFVSVKLRPSNKVTARLRKSSGLVCVNQTYSVLRQALCQYTAFLQFFKYLLKISIRVKVINLCCFYDLIDYRRSLCAIRRVAEKTVLSADNEWFYRSFCRIVCKLNFRVNKTPSSSVTITPPFSFVVILTLFRWFV